VNGASFKPPDFVVVGVPTHDGSVWLLASTELRSFELEAVYEHEDVFNLGICVGSGRLKYISMHGKCSSYIMVMGATYAEAFAKLMGEWSPDASRGFTELPATPAELTP
jgi:hypothetical protein